MDDFESMTDEDLVAEAVWAWSDIEASEPGEEKKQNIERCELIKKALLARLASLRKHQEAEIGEGEE